MGQAVLATAPIATENIPMVEYPCALINGFIPMAIIDGSKISDRDHHMKA